MKIHEYFLIRTENHEISMKYKCQNMGRMSPQWIKLFIIYILLTQFAETKCPNQCRCSLDGRGRKKVTCQNGGMMNSIPINHMPSHTQVLIITAPPLNQNYLSLGPIFKGLRKLEEIHLTYSSVPNIGAHSFWGLKDLKVLNLTRNSLSTLMDTNFKGLGALKNLDLSRNFIESVPSAVFRHARHLHTLNLSHNKIQNMVSRIFFGLTRLEHLDLSYNPLNEIKPDLFTDIPVLKKFACAGCQLTTVSGDTLMVIPEVKDLNLQNNYLIEIPDGLPTLTNLMSLKLDGNQISHISEYTFTDSPSTHVHLSHNYITDIEIDAFINSTITHLDLSYNRLSELAFGGFPAILHSVRDLQLSGNPIKTDQLFELLKEAHQLHHLGIGDVGLSVVPSLIGQGRGIHNLNLSSNYISNLPHEIFTHSPHLKVLDISNNKFEGIGDDVLEAMTRSRNLRTLKIEGNPWQCDQCHVGPLLRWLQRSPDQESGCNEPRVWTCLRCVGPDEVEGQPLALLPIGDLPMCLSPPTKASLSLSDPSSKSVEDGQELLSHDGNQEYIDVLDELKIGPPLADQPVYSRGSNSDMSLGGGDAFTSSNLVTISVGILSMIMIVMCVVSALVYVYRKRSTDKNDNDSLSKAGKQNMFSLKIFSSKEMKHESEQESTVSNDSELKTPDLTKETDVRVRDIQTELSDVEIHQIVNCEETSSSKSENISDIIRETTFL